jgi:phage tail-like protein
MRGLADVPMPYPSADFLPAVLREDDLLVRWTAALDLVTAPVVATLDCLEAYLDPWLTPPDFLAWLGECVGARLDENWPVERRRAAVAEAVAAHRLRGTTAGLRMLAERAADAPVEISDTGGVRWSTRPSTDPEPPAEPRVRIRVPASASVTEGSLAELVRGVVPLGVAVDVEVVRP